MVECYDDLKTFVEDKQGSIVKFVTKTNPFSIMIVTQLQGDILCEYQIKIKDESDMGETYKKRDKYNHLMYEFERADTVQDLINALMFTVEALRKKSIDENVKNLQSNVTRIGKKYESELTDIKDQMEHLQVKEQVELHHLCENAEKVFQGKLDQLVELFDSDQKGESTKESIKDKIFNMTLKFLLNHNAADNSLLDKIKNEMAD